MWLLIRYKQKKLHTLCNSLKKYKLISDYYIPSFNLDKKDLPAMLNYCFVEIKTSKGEFEVALRDFPIKFAVESIVRDDEVEKVKNQIKIINQNLPGDIVVGSKVLIKSGSFSHFTAQVLEMGTAKCKVVIVDKKFLGQEIEMEIEYKNLVLLEY